MKKYIHLFLAASISAAASCYLFLLPNMNFSESKKDKGKSLSSLADDGYFAARAFPDDVISLRTYESALVEARTQMLEQQALRGGGFNGNWTTQGPKNIGARVNTIAVNPQNENIIYIGFSNGGLFKTIDGGLNWNPIFDNQPYLTIGDIEIDPVNPNIIYVGTGDPNIGYYSSVGDGVWKSTDAGATWTFLGLKDQRIISRVEVNPKNSNIIYAAAMGLPYQKNNDRGLYKSIDGGVTWTQKLFVSDTTGVCDFMINPQDPNIIYASTWDRIRSNKRNHAAGEAAAVYKSSDAGNTWTKLSGGLPTTGRFSRTGITMYEKDPNILFAVFVSATSYNPEGIYKSLDAGVTWNKFSENNDIDNVFGGFGWYFAGIEVNPNDPNDIFLLGVDLWRSKDNGENWALATPEWFDYTVHADKHDLVFTPSGKMILGTDGGAYKSENNAVDWTDIENIATTQFYRVAYNPNEPDFYYGGAQDNGSTGGNAQIQEWSRLYGGDGFQIRFDAKRPNVRFYETQNTNIIYFSDTEAYVDVLSAEQAGDRKHWDGQYFLSKYTEGTMYLGTQRVWKGIYDPNSVFDIEWTAISPDLTDNDGSPSPRNTITTLEESPLEKDLLYAGTADANAWRLSPNTSTWVNISAGLPDRYITRITPSPSNKNSVFITLSGYREFEKTAHIWKSDNQGTTWKNISGDMPQVAVNDILVLENNKDSVLFAATDAGVYFSKNAGKNWLRLGGNMPIIPVFDIEYNPVKNQLFAGTFARSIMSFDLKNIGVDIKAIVSDKQAILNANVKVFPTLFDNSFTVSSAEKTIIGIKIYNIEGRLFLNKPENDTQVSIEAKDFPKGIYLVEVLLEGNNKVIKKVVRE